MFQNIQEMFSDNQAVTVDAISSVIDLLPQSIVGSSGHANVQRDIGAGTPIYLYALVTTAFTTGDAGVLTVTLESDSTADLATSATVHMTLASLVAAATLTAGYWIAKGVPLPPGNYERYLGLRYLTTTGDMTAGKIQAWLSPDPYSSRTYEAGSRSGIN